MQSYEDDNLLQTETGTLDELITQMSAQAMPDGRQATHHIIGKIPAAGTEITISGLVWVVEKSSARGWMRLRLKQETPGGRQSGGL